MTTPAVHSTFLIERSYPVPTDRLFRAFADPELKRRWFAVGEHHLEHFEMEFGVGGVERLRYRLGDQTPFPGLVLESEGRILDLVPEERLVMAATMGFGDMTISASLLTFEFAAADAGSTLLCTHQGVFFEGADGPQIREMGWQALFDRLATELS